MRRVGVFLLCFLFFSALNASISFDRRILGLQLTTLLSADEPNILLRKESFPDLSHLLMLCQNSEFSDSYVAHYAARVSEEEVEMLFLLGDRDDLYVPNFRSFVDILQRMTRASFALREREQYFLDHDITIDRDLNDS